MPGCEQDGNRHTSADKPAMAPLLPYPYFLPSVPFSQGWEQAAISRTPQPEFGPGDNRYLGANRHLVPLGAQRRASPQTQRGGTYCCCPSASLRQEENGPCRSSTLSARPGRACRQGPLETAGAGGRRPARRGAGPPAAGRGGRLSQPSCVRCRGWGGCWRRGGGGGRRAAASAPWPATARSSGGGPTLPITASTLVSSSTRGPVTSPPPSFLLRLGTGRGGERRQPSAAPAEASRVAGGVGPEAPLYPRGRFAWKVRGFLGRSAFWRTCWTCTVLRAGAARSLQSSLKGVEVLGARGALGSLRMGLAEGASPQPCVSSVGVLPVPCGQASPPGDVMLRRHWHPDSRAAA